MAAGLFVSSPTSEPMGWWVNRLGCIMRVLDMAGREKSSLNIRRICSNRDAVKFCKMVDLDLETGCRLVGSCYVVVELETSRAIKHLLPTASPRPHYPAEALMSPL